jgi:hypothetical protein
MDGWSHQEFFGANKEGKEERKFNESWGKERELRGLEIGLSGWDGDGDVANEEGPMWGEKTSRMER